MSFLDRFKRKPKPEDAPVPDSKQEKPGPAGFAAKAKPAGEPHVTPQKPSPSADDVRLELGDFLHRIPAQLLLAGPHELKTELRFDTASLSQWIAQGITMVNLAEIYRRVPQIFRAEVVEADNVEIRFPWQKIQKLLAATKGEVSADGSAGSVSTLAEKLRPKKPGLKPPAGAAQPSPASRVLPGRGGAQAGSWFTRTGSDKPVERPPQLPPKTSGAGAPAVPAPEAGRLPESPLRIAKETPVPAAGAAVAPKVDVQLADLPADVQRRVAVMCGDYERQIVELEKQRKSLAEAHERSAEEVEKLRKDVDNAMNQVAQGNTAVSIRADLAGRANKEREKMTAELDAKHKEIERLKAEIAKFENVTETPGAAATPGVAGGRRKRDSERMVEELNRRIKSMEQAQKESALELAREKESRSKAEKFLASADKLQVETATYMESAKQEMRKEVELGVKHREADMRKALKDLQVEVDALQAHNKTVNADLDAARLRAAELEVRLAGVGDPVAHHSAMVERLESEIENYRDRLKVLLHERDEARSEKDRATGEIQKKIEAETRLAREREQERAEAEKRIAESAARVASLDQLAQAKDAEIRELQAAIESRGSAGSDVAVLRKQLDAIKAQQAEEQVQFRREREAMLQERQQFTGKLREQGASLEGQINALVVERDRLRKETEAVNVRFHSEITGREEIAAKIQAEHASALKAREDIARQLAETERAFKDLKKQHARVASGAQGLLADPVLQTEMDQLRSQIASARDAEKKAAAAKQEAEAQLAGIRAERQGALTNLTEQREASERLEQQMGQVQGELARLRSKLDNVTRERDEAETEMQRVAIELSELEKSAGQDVATLTAERDATRKELDSIMGQLAEARSHHEHLAGSLDATRESLVAEIAHTTGKLTEVDLRRQQLESQLAAEQAAQSEKLANLQARHDQSKDTFSAELEKIRKELAAAYAKIASSEQTLSEATRSANQERAALLQEKAEVERRVAELQKTMTEAARRAGDQ